MEFTFLLPLTIGLMVGYKAWGSQHDIAHLAVVFAIVNLLVSLLLAPWEIQVVLLILIVVLAGPLWQKFDNKNNFQVAQTNEDKDATLHYRGVTYESPKSAVSIEETKKVTKCYRGIDYESSGAYTRSDNDPKGKVIKYRGINIKTKAEDQD
ncbi:MULTISPECIES: DUF4278 domain-containing protein [unclassified Synechocystis]|uniref:DUF4278 domain-containing protein n=1 Tax=unclassified Synechocystis TaxID=2640012 RepID=UPI000422CDA5|nr:MULTISPECIES: DUF4278 domain-containing protein [unclassified Synechocystis]AIE73602.1 hypothetical protein D082_10740 [Synechocystis sp. PCC 6714]MCT0254966.1 DUF4278 domain-containing protein [Synechocystis sp. CS-94]